MEAIIVGAMALVGTFAVHLLSYKRKEHVKHVICMKE